MQSSFDEEPNPTGRLPVSRWRQRMAVLALLGAGVGAYLTLGQALPHDHDVAWIELSPDR